jgi:hypothetical protein
VNWVEMAMEKVQWHSFVVMDMNILNIFPVVTVTILCEPNK